MKKETNGEKVNWLKVKWIRVSKSNLKSKFANYGFDESRFIEILASDKSTRGRPQTIANAKNLAGMVPGWVPFKIVSVSAVLYPR